MKTKKTTTTKIKRSQPWTVKNGKVLDLEGNWLTPIQLLRKVKKYVLQFPEKYEQEACFEKTECGTVGCIAGWGLALTVGYKHAENSSFEETIGQFISGSEFPHWPWLFDAGWSGELGEELSRAETPKQRSKAAAKAIEHYIKYDAGRG